jgi:hypothetical protein
MYGSTRKFPTDAGFKIRPHRERAADEHRDEHADAPRHRSYRDLEEGARRAGGGHDRDHGLERAYREHQHMRREMEQPIRTRLHHDDAGGLERLVSSNVIEPNVRSII